MKVCGKFTMQVWENGALVEEYCDANLIMNAWLHEFAVAVATGTLALTPAAIGFGTNGTAPTSDDTSLEPGAYIKAFLPYTPPPSGNTHGFSWVLESSEANGMEIQEFGLLAGDHTLLARKVRSAPLTKTTAIRLTGGWSISFEAE